MSDVFWTCHLIGKIPSMIKFIIDVAEKALDGRLADDEYISNMLQIGEKAQKLVEEIGYETP